MTSEIDKKIIEYLTNEEKLGFEKTKEELENVLIEINKDLNIEEIEKELENGNVIVFNNEDNSYIFEENNNEDNNGYDKEYNISFNKNTKKELREYLKKDFKKKLNIKTQKMN